MVLCSSFLQTLATGLYFSPARAEEYIGENSTRGFLALIDDAVASLEGNVQMESIGHHELARILEGELAVVRPRFPFSNCRSSFRLSVNGESLQSSLDTTRVSRIIYILLATTC